MSKHFNNDLMIDLDALVVQNVVFYPALLQGIAWRVAIAHFLHAERRNAAAAAFDGAFGENIATAMPRMTMIKIPKVRRRVFMCVFLEVSSIIS